MRAGPASRRAPRGFTLLEILVATAVGAIVLLVINATYFGALRLHNTTHDKIDSDLALQRALGIVRRDLAGIMLPGGPNGGANTNLATAVSGALQTSATGSLGQDPAGERVSPDLYTSTGKVDGWTPYADVQMVAYFLAPATDGSGSKNLVRAVTRNLLPAQDAVPDEQVLLPGVASATMSFYDGTSWTDSWDSTVSTTMPTALKFSLVLAGRDASQPAPAPTELIVPVMVATAASATAAAAAGGAQ